MSNEKHRQSEDTQKPPTANQVPESDVPQPDPAPRNQRHSDQGKLQATYEAQRTEGIRRANERIPKRDS